ncbi:putative metalloprotease CJM1_0395 family protein [Caminibacter pacificus]
MIGSVTNNFNIYSNNYQKKDILKDPKIMQEISKLQSIDSKVRAHEMAHQAAGGGLAGAPTYSTVKGPDGKEYAVAGEVPIKIQKGKTPEETIKLMNQVKAAALAPADPSPQDLKVAQTADMIAAKAMQEMNNNFNDQNYQNPKMKIDLYA